MGTKLEVLSWGAGVQSTAIALLIEQGKLPRPDAIMWADTGSEPEAVYAHVEKWRDRLNAIAPFVVVRKGGKRPALHDAVIAKARTGKGSNTLPFFLAGKDGSAPSFVRRGCTSNYKTIPLNRAAAKMAKERGLDGHRWWLGISRDELQRMKVGAWHPLIELFEGGWRSDALRRADCLSVIAAAGETAPRSSCVFCPFRTREEWAALSAKDRELVMRLDREVGDGFAKVGKHGALVDRPFLRVDCQPADSDEWFELAPDPQMAFGWDNECAGICGV